MHADAEEVDPAVSRRLPLPALCFTVIHWIGKILPFRSVCVNHVRLHWSPSRRFPNFLQRGSSS
jgi:hypothetical protein